MCLAVLGRDVVFTSPTRRRITNFAEISDGTAPALGLAMRRVASFLTAFLLLSAPALAHADDTLTPQPAAVTEWYGWQSLIADGSSIGIMVGGNAARSPGAGYFGIAGWYLASPVIHAVHGHGGKAAAALGLRLGLPVLGGLVGAAAQNDRSDEDVPAGLVYGALLGVVAAMVIDDVVLANEDVVPEPTPDAPTLGPTASVVHGGATVGLGGSF